ncbi:hypothetical protein ACIQUF_24335 [Pseudomonas sp. NPDC090233]|uniref:hypothetical protein n=1 Tax=Pseudomonas sp. NPDC090233 TaxID=3364479 RepID=UPI003839FB06
MRVQATSSKPLLFRVMRPAIVPGIPLVPKALAGRLNFHQSMYYDDYLDVQVPSFQGMSGQSIRVEWVGRAITWTSDPQPPPTPQLLTFQVPRLEVIDSIGHTVTIRAVVNDTIRSQAFALIIEPQVLVLPEPQFHAQPNEATDAVSLLYSGQQDRHTGRVRWHGSIIRDTDEEDLQEGRREYFQINRSWIQENLGREVLINYTARRPGDSQSWFSQVLRMNF